MINCVILAAGRGSRLGGLTANQPKPLTAVGGIPLVERAISAFEKAALPTPVLVVGYRADSLSFLKLRTIPNLEWEDTGIFHSLSCAHSLLSTATTIVAYGDIFFGADDLRCLAEAEGDIVITYDPNAVELWQRRFDNPLTDLERLEINSDGRCLLIGGRPIRQEDVDGQFTGLFKLSPRGWAQINSALETCPQSVRRTTDMTSVLDMCLKENIEVHCLPLRQPWGEVDTASDITLYEQMYFTEYDAEIGGDAREY